MIDDPLTGLAVIAATAAAAQITASRLGIPSVLLLLVGGIAVGPILDPDELYGELLFTAVGLGVAVLLFEGGAGLRWRDLTIGRAPVVRLVTIGALLAWAVGAAAALLMLDIGADIAMLMGAILIVSGPTVVLPLLRVLRAREPVDSILRWEGIVIDPIGAGLAIITLDAIIEERAPARIALRAATTFGAGILVGGIVALLLIEGLRRHIISDHHQIAATMAAIIVTYAVANELRPEAGLVGATVLGLAFANQRRTPASHIAEFNEHLGLSILGLLFVVLGARVAPGEILDNLGPSLGIVAALVLIGRPLSVLASTFGTATDWRTRAFLMTVAPRGVVAAAVASLFSIELEHHGVDPGPLVPVVFTVVVATVVIAVVAATVLSRRLHIAQPPANGVALTGGGEFALAFAEALGRLQVPTMLIGLDDDEADLAAERGLLAYRGRLDSDDFARTVEAVGVGAGVALSGTDHLDRYVSERLAPTVESPNLYSLADPSPTESAADQALAPRQLLPDHVTAERLSELMRDGVRVRTVSGARHPRSGWLTICRVDQSRQVVFDPDPTNAEDGDWLIQLGPGLRPDAEQ